MSEFKFGDLVDYFGKPFLFLKGIHDGDCLIVDELETDTVAMKELTLISRHQEWVSVDSKDEKSLPTKNRWYMTFCPSAVGDDFDGVSMLFLCDDTGGDDGDLIWIGDGDDVEFSSITHYMALPEPPKS